MALLKTVHICANTIHKTLVGRCRKLTHIVFSLFDLVVVSCHVIDLSHPFDTILVCSLHNIYKKLVGKFTACYIVILGNWLLVCYTAIHVCAVFGSCSSQGTIPFSICISRYTGAVKRLDNVNWSQVYVMTCTKQPTRLETRLSHTWRR